LQTVKWLHAHHAACESDVPDLKASRIWPVLRISAFAAASHPALLHACTWAMLLEYENTSQCVHQEDETYHLVLPAQPGACIALTAPGGTGASVESANRREAFTPPRGLIASFYLVDRGCAPVKVGTCEHF
jgi:hypothetical protein